MRAKESWEETRLIMALPRRRERAHLLNSSVSRR